MKKTIHLTITTLILLIFILGCNQESSKLTGDSIHSTSSTKTTIKIGVISALTGPISTISLPSKNAIELAAHDWNSNPHHKTQFKIIYEDNLGQANPSVTAFNKLTKVDNVAAIITDISMTTMTLAPLANKNQIPLVAYLSTSPSVLGAGKFIYRTSPMNIEGMTLIIDHMLNQNQTRVATITELYDYPIALNKIFEKKSNIKGINLISSEKFSTTDDLRTMIIKSTKNNPDAIMIFVQTPKTGLNLIKQIKELDISTPLYGNEHFCTDMALRIEGLENVICSAPEYNTNTIDELKIKYSNFYNENQILDWLYIATGYDAANVLFETIEKTGTNSKKIKEYLDSIDNFNGYTGLDKFDEQGDIAQKNYNLLIIKNNKKIKLTT